MYARKMNSNKMEIMKLVYVKLAKVRQFIIQMKISAHLKSVLTTVRMNMEVFKVVVINVDKDLDYNRTDFVNTAMVNSANHVFLQLMNVLNVKKVI